jgi:hypothetical protein
VALSRETTLFLLRDSIDRRRGLIHGRLHDGRGGHCALGCFWADNPKATLKNDLIDEVAAVNDSLGVDATPRQRWLKVRSWLRFKLCALAGVNPHP